VYRMRQRGGDGCAKLTLKLLAWHAPKYASQLHMVEILAVVLRCLSSGSRLVLPNLADDPLGNFIKADHRMPSIGPFRAPSLIIPTKCVTRRTPSAPLDRSGLKR
jgi:hypothetical protein